MIRSSPNSCFVIDYSSDAVPAVVGAALAGRLVCTDVTSKFDRACEEARHIGHFAALVSGKKFSITQTSVV